MSNSKSDGPTPENPGLAFGEKFNLPKSEARSMGEIDMQKRRNLIDQEKMARYMQRTPKFKQAYEDQRKLMKNPAYELTAEHALNAVPGLSEGFDKHGLDSKHLGLIEKFTQANFRNDQLMRKAGLTRGALYRGKLGVDTFFIAFGILGVVILPFYFYFRGSGNRQKMAEFHRTIDKDPLRDQMDIDDLSFDLKKPQSAVVRERVLEKLKHQETVTRLGREDKKSQRS
jgi:hypothetical protein